MKIKAPSTLTIRVRYRLDRDGVALALWTIDADADAVPIAAGRAIEFIRWMIVERLFPPSPAWDPATDGPVPEWAYRLADRLFPGLATPGADLQDTVIEAEARADGQG